jgi:hypothetical protein
MIWQTVSAKLRPGQLRARIKTLVFTGGSLVTKDRKAELLWKQIFRGYLSDAMDLFFPEISKLWD